LGFIAYFNRQLARSNADGNRQLFPELKLTGERGKLGDLPSRFWRDYLSAIAIKSGADGMGAHSFRHTISDRLRTAGYLDREFGPLILGHSDKSVTGGYGELKQGTAKMRHDMLDAVEFDDIDFGKLHTAMS
jgi:integrase